MSPWRSLNETLYRFRNFLKRVGSFLRNGSGSSGTLQGFIDEVERASGYARNDVRAKAKSWLISHRSSLAEKDILLAKFHFGYLLPDEWDA